MISACASAFCNVNSPTVTGSLKRRGPALPAVAADPLVRSSWLSVRWVDPDPHVLCFGPALDYRFLSCFARAHAVVPYRVEGGRLYVYDPDRPRDRGRYVEFRCGGADRGLEFAYGRFRSQEGWGLTLVPASALRRGGRLLYEAVRQLKVARSV